MSICITTSLHLLLLFLNFSAGQQLSLSPPPPWLGRVCSRTHFHVIPTCRRGQNCQSPSWALDAMCNSFNTRPGRYPYHWCNGLLMPPCILRASTRQLLIRLIYSSRTLGSLRPSEVIPGSRVIPSGARKETSFRTSYLQPGSSPGSTGGGARTEKLTER